MRRSVEQRHAKILEHLKLHCEVHVASLSNKLRISEVTIRKDLTELERLGMLTRTYGGAVSRDRGYLYHDFDARMTTMQAEKRAIASAAAKRVSAGNLVMLNSGSTNMIVSQAWFEVPDLTIITNCVRTALEVREHGNSEVILLGGVLRKRFHFTGGRDTIRVMDRYHADVCFISVDGFDAVNGLSTYYREEAEVIQHMLAASSLKVVVADSSKLGRTSVECVCSPQDIDLLITDTGVAPKELAALRRTGLEVATVRPLASAL